MVRNACMTCYEPLRAEEPLAQAEPMAYHIMKWWRSKFRNGYKKFSIGSESERTDTEELVGRAPSQCSAPPDLLPSEARAMLQPTATTPSRRPRHATPPPSPPPSPPETRDKNRIRFEELTCDVQVEHETPQHQPLQFSFTLYDLDGHGRMTKDDIAGIVSTIYESVGKSVTVPHYGSKTIQVRLTVVPESRSHRSQRPRRRTRKTQNDDEETPKVHKTNSDDDNAVLMPRHKRRSGSLQRRQLLQIIQANMEKNNLNFQTHRKSQDQKPAHIEEEPSSKPHRHRSRACTFSEKPSHDKYKQEPHHNYLDLAHDRNIYDKPRVDRSPPERTYDVRPTHDIKHDLRQRDTERPHVERIYDRPDETINDPNLCRYDRYLHAVICSSAKHANSGFHHKNIPKSNHKSHKNQHRSRSHEVRAGAPEPRVLQIIFL